MSQERGQGKRPLAELLAYIASNKPTGHESDPVQPLKAPEVSGAAGEPIQMAYFRELWADINASRQLHESRAQVPGNAGPLNTSQLIYRSLTLMHDQAPGYLQHFLMHVEALTWMAQLTNSEEARQAPRTTNSRKKR
ncbi:DUF2894 domain-containing protein [Pusillimonas sp. CC-YST705]|uniref:DUF2894 domain-containing protein n=1 Tax=Mesopusillimonas faecipullorum TaxID=2755040 RepID=A0ABS8CDE6_9BURK|nr:DUF2894 domain-containing protein [Mesopusillimonas faecipullorum]MCB5364058.1 DUF2894 domain-containing protein [Mesopusillimonas faecipullorum]